MFLSILLHTALLFSGLFEEIFYKSIYLHLCTYKNLYELHCTVYTVLKLKDAIYLLLINFSVSAKFRACYITGSRVRGASFKQNKEYSFIFLGAFLAVFVVFHNEFCVYIMMYDLNKAYFS